MLFPISPKLKRNLNRILPFGIIWLITGWVFLASEALITRNQNLNPDSSVNLTLPVFIFASVASISVGLLVGLIELVILERRFRNHSFRKKVFIKFVLYLLLMLTLMGILFPVATSIELSSSIFHQKIFQRTINFFQSVVFLNTVIQISFQLMLSLLYAAISENLGHQVLTNFFSGKYHQPKKETRIFMFLDMKSSTTIAEKLGHHKYFELLQAYYEIMSAPIINTWGEVYQYIGDEVVITWTAEKGLIDINCLRCFYLIKQALKEASVFFESRFGLVPDFKAALHSGEVTTGEIGALKKEVIYTGDVLNTTARAQGLCSQYEADLIITDDLLQSLSERDSFSWCLIGDLPLRGKSQSVKLYEALQQ